MTADPDEVVRAARRWIGTPYHHGASLMGIGTDCLGLIRGVYRDLIGDEPETPTAYSRYWAELSHAETLLDAADRNLIRLPSAKPTTGTVLAFRWRGHLPAKHLGIAVSPRRMIHAVEGHAVMEIELASWWQRHIAAAYEFPHRTN